MTKYWTGLRTHLVRLDKHRTTIDFHLNKLQEIDLIEKIKVGKEIKYVLKDEEMIWAFFVRYQKELSDEVIDIWIRSREKGLIVTINNMSNFFLDMFPIPFRA